MEALGQADEIVLGWEGVRVPRGADRGRKMTHEIPVGPVTFTGWSLREEGNAQLYSFLLNQTLGRALQIVEDPVLEGRGFEAWRRLKEEFEPKGGSYEMRVAEPDVSK